MPQRYRVGDPVIFIVSKISAQPGPRAQDVRPAPHGDTYNYIVEKYWRVRELLPDGRLLRMTPGCAGPPGGSGCLRKIAFPR